MYVHREEPRATESMRDMVLPLSRLSDRRHHDRCSPLATAKLHMHSAISEKGVTNNIGSWQHFLFV